MKLSGFKKNLYLSEDVKNIRLNFLSKKIFNGNFYSPGVEGTNKFLTLYRKDVLLVKDIFANLLAKNICARNEKIKPILLIRNPFAVALSIRNKKNWDWMNDPAVLLKQKSLLDDYLKPFQKLILNTSKNGSCLDKQILIWSIINYIPLVQFGEDELLVTFYEDWISNPEFELEKTYIFINEKPFFPLQIQNSKIFINASKTTTKSTFDILDWKDILTVDEVSSGERILKQFGFGNLYDKFSIPNRGVIQEVRSKFKTRVVHF